MSTTLAMIVVMTIVVAALASMIAVNISNARSQELSQRAFNIAEAGANYYLWHLSHNPGDFKDGLATPSTPDPQLGYGPYTHDYYDTSGRKTGTYTLWIKPQSNGSTIATVRVIGKAQSTSGSSTRTVEVKIGAPSYASYGLLADNEVWFGSTESASTRTRGSDLMARVILMQQAHGARMYRVPHWVATAQRHILVCGVRRL